MTTVNPEGRLRIEGIGFRCTIGVTERERATPQPVEVTLELRLDVGDVVRSDAIGDTVDYRAVARRVIELGEASDFRLIEALAGYLGETLLGEFPRLAAVRVELGKPGALSAARAVSTVIVAERKPRPA